uniref:GAR domain-containing protein n=1 Tax=Eptatretus burgeri TaxID=7764 RepID=A0A8C4QJ60_EPTBU
MCMPMQPCTHTSVIPREVTRKVAACRCPKRFQVEQIEENKYRFGESQQLRLVRILRSAVMVRVGGGWSSLDEFLLKNDPCRASVDGCSTMDMRNRLAVPDGKGLTAAAFQPKPRRSPLGRSPSAPSLPQQISGASAIINPKGKVSRASSQRSVKSRTPVAKTSQSSASSPSNRSGCSSKKLSRSRSLGKPEDLMAWETVASPVYSQTDIAHQSESRQVHTGAHQPNGKSSRIPTAMPTSALSRKTSNRWR